MNQVHSTGFQGQANPGYQGQANPGFQGQANPGFQGQANPGFQGQPQQTVITQPTAQHFNLPAVLKSKGPAPPGLEYLAQLDQILIKQQIELLELLTGYETNNRYKIFNSMGQQILFAQEETDCFQRQCCKAARGFVVHVTDNTGQEVMRIIRDFKCCAGWPCCAFSDCCAYELVVEAPVGSPIGYVRQMCSPWKPKFGIFDAQHEQVAQIDGPCCICSGPCCGDVEFPVTALDSPNEDVGMCAKQWSGFVLESFTTADNFNVRFPLDMDVKVKATLIGAILMLDFMYFEQKNNQGGYYG